MITSTTIADVGFVTTPMPDIVEGVQNAIITAAPTISTAFPATAFNDISAMESMAIAECEQISVMARNSFAPSTVVNELMVREQAKMLGLSLGLFTRTNVTVEFLGTAGFYVAKGFLVSDGAYDYRTVSGIVLDGDGAGRVQCVATQDGAWDVPANTVNTISESIPITVTLTCNNPTDGVPSKGDELPSALRGRVYNAYHAPVTGSIAYAKRLLMDLGIPDYRIWIDKKPKVVVGGDIDDYAVAAAIFDSGLDFARLSIAQGAGTTPSIVVDGQTIYGIAINDYPNTYQMKFVKAAAVELKIVFNVTATSNFAQLSGINTAVAQAVYDYINSLAIGRPINRVALQNVGGDAFATIVDRQFLIGIDFTVYLLSEPSTALAWSGNLIALDSYGETYPTIELANIGAA